MGARCPRYPIPACRFHTQSLTLKDLSNLLIRGHSPIDSLPCIHMKCVRAGSIIFAKQTAMLGKWSLWTSWLSMSPNHKQYFLTYLAQGLGRVGKEYLKTSAASVLNMWQMQIFSNLGSLEVFLLKPDGKHHSSAGHPFGFACLRRNCEVAGAKWLL